MTARKTNASVDLDRAAFDAIDTRGAAEQICAANQNFPRARESNTRFSAAQNDFIARGERHHFPVNADVDWFRHGLGNIRLEEAEDNWFLQITVLQHQH